MKKIILLIMVLSLLACTKNETKEDIEPSDETIPYGYIYNYDDEPLMNRSVYNLDFEYLDFAFFSQRIALPTMGEFCKEPLTSQPDIACEVLIDEIYYYDIDAILGNISDDMYLSELEGGYDTGTNFHYKDTDFYKLVDGQEIIPIPSIYTVLEPHFRELEYGFNTDDIPYYRISKTYQLKTANKYNLSLSYIEIDEAYIIQIRYYYVFYPRPSNYEPVYAYGYILKS